MTRTNCHGTFVLEMMKLKVKLEWYQSENDMYDMPIEDFNDIQRKIGGDKPNLFEFIQKKDSRDSRSRSRDDRRDHRRDDRPLRNFAPVRESLRPNLGKETLDDMVYASADISRDRSLGQEMGYSMEELDRKLDGEGRSQALRRKDKLNHVKVKEAIAEFIKTTLTTVIRVTVAICL